MTQPFSSVGLRPELIEALAHIGFESMTPIQSAALPALLRGEDVVGQAQTGSGKTAAFGLALLHRIEVRQRSPQALVLCPTRELAEQVATEIRRLARNLAQTRVITLCGGRPFRGQLLGLEHGAHVIVGTPGRVCKHLLKRTLNLRMLRVLVLDEADRMLDMGFVDEVSEVVASCPRDRQTLLFSATFPPSIERLSAGVQREPVRVTVGTQVEAQMLRQLVVHCEREQRVQRVVDLLGAHEPASALVFCETRNDCKRLTHALVQRGAAALELHGELEQRDRDDALMQFTNGSARVLVATNVAARGLDIPALPLVLISELSPDPESHLHRIGRTGRAGEQGLAISVVASPREERRLDAIEESLGAAIEVGPDVPSCQRLDGLAATHRTLLLLDGRKQKLRKGDVLGALIKDGGLPPEAIGRIDLMENTCGVAITPDYAQQALRHVRQGKVKGRKIRAQLLG